MQYGLAAWGLREESLESQLRITSGLGLDLLEFSIANYEKDALQIGATPEQIREVKEMFRKYGIRLECGCTGNDFTGDDVEEQIRKVTEVIDIAAELGIRFLRIFAGFQSDSVVCGKRKTRMLDALRTVQAHAEQKQVLLCVETHGGVTALENGALHHFHSATTRTDLWKEILETGVSCTYDPANLAAVGSCAPCCILPRVPRKNRVSASEGLPGHGRRSPSRRLRRGTAGLELPAEHAERLLRSRDDRI